MRDAQTIREDIEKDDATEVVLVSDGLGRSVDCVGRDPDAADEVAVSLDIAAAALQVLGSALSLGSLEDAILTFENGIVVLRDNGDGRMFSVIASSGAKAGLLLNQVRRLTPQERDDHTEGA